MTVDFIDNGKGIPQESQALIFEKFSRLTDANRAGGAIASEAATVGKQA